MRRYAASGIVVLLVGCGASLPFTMTAVTSTPDHGVFQCATQHAKTMDFKVLSNDEGELRLVVRKENRDIHIADPTFYQALDELTIEVHGRPDGGAVLGVTARTWLEFSTRRGRTLEARKATEMAEMAARSLVEQCGGERDVDQNGH